MSDVIATRLSVDERKQQTNEAFANPNVGDCFQEMYSFWVFVVAVEPNGRIATLDASGPCTFPKDGKLRVYGTHEEFRSRFSYGRISGYWVMLDRRGLDVAGWFEGWPVPVGPADCAVCAAHVAGAR